MDEGKSIEQLTDELQQSQQALADCNKKLDDAIAEKQLLEEQNENMRKEIETLSNPAEEQEVKSGVNECFEYNGEKYKVLTNGVRIPGIGKRSALEILTDEKSQEWLVKNKSGVIRKMA